MSGRAGSGSSEPERQRRIIPASPPAPVMSSSASKGTGAEHDWKSAASGDVVIADLRGGAGPLDTKSSDRVLWISSSLMPIAILLTIFGGLSNGSFALPMKKMKGWAWEHGWFSWALSGLIIVPVAAALLTIPNLGEVYANTSIQAHSLVLLFGFLWGISGLLFGLGIDRLGLALGYGIILGLSSAIGAIGPFITKHPDKLLTPAGFLTMAGVALEPSPSLFVATTSGSGPATEITIVMPFLVVA